MENLGKHRDIKLVTTDPKRNKLISEPNSQTIKQFLENMLVIQMKNHRPLLIGMNKKVYHFSKMN